MKKGLAEIAFVLDRSGSMFGLEADTVGGFNSMLEKQRKLEGEAYVTTVLFNSEIDRVHDRVPLSKVENMTKEDFVVGGCTALLDAIGSTVQHIESIHKYAREEDIPEHTIIVIITDGMENASKRFSVEKVRQMIGTKEAENGWEFLFLGANIDAVSTASTFGIRHDRSVSYRSDSAGTALNYDVVGDVLCEFRADSKISPCWKSRIESSMSGKD